MKTRPLARKNDAGYPRHGSFWDLLRLTPGALLLAAAPATGDTTVPVKPTVPPQGKTDPATTKPVVKPPVVHTRTAGVPVRIAEPEPLPVAADPGKGKGDKKPCPLPPQEKVPLPGKVKAPTPLPPPPGAPPRPRTPTPPPPPPKPAPPAKAEGKGPTTLYVHPHGPDEPCLPGVLPA